MSKINDLIEKLCPNGVIHYQLSELEDNKKILLGRGNVISKNEIRDYPGDYPVYSSSAVGNGEIGKYGKYMFDDVRLSWSIDGGGRFFYRDAPKYSITNVSGWLKVVDDAFINSKYLYYVLTNEWTKKVYDYSHKAHPSVIRKEYCIPIPPIEVQEEIARILDKFGELKAELEAELEMRKSQYEFWRGKLLNDEGMKVKLKDVCHYSKDRISHIDLNENNYIGVDNLLQNKMGKVESSHIPSSGNSTKFIENDILIGNIRPYLKKIWFADCIGGTNGDVLDIRANDKSILYPKYLYYVLSSDNFFDYNNSNSKGAKMPRGDKQAIMNYEFNIPSYNKQIYIVNILDRFDKLINDITVGLPAEIELRRKQYEYYRNELLSFEEYGNE